MLATDVGRCYATPPESGRTEQTSRPQTFCGAAGAGAEHAALFLADADILIGYLQRHSIAVRFVVEHASITVSTMSVAERYASVRGTAEDAECQDLENFFAPFPVVPVSADIARVDGLYCLFRARNKQ
ncbi:MAG: hypothetical protein OXJ37_09555 [Bryobacterales bacterium]|nr:hypothetical protein [Bryobacterales bacterium]MDE0623043.1 hypothetical protein [Bryobacterales bacterium]